MSQNLIKSTTQTTLFDQKRSQNKIPLKQQSQNIDKKCEDQQKQTKKQSRIQTTLTQELQSQKPQKKLPPRVQLKVNNSNSNNNRTNINQGQRTLNYLRQDSNKSDEPKISSQSSSQEISSQQSINDTSIKFTLPKQDYAQFQKILSELNSDLIVSKLNQFDSFISQLLQNIMSYLQSLPSYNTNHNNIQSLTYKIQKQIKFILYRFLTGSPFSMWNSLYCPQRVSQLIEEVNGKFIQLWIRKYYKGIKDKVKSESLFGYVDSDDDFSEYFDKNEVNNNMNEEYQQLLEGNICKSWKNKGNILILNGQQGCGKTTALRSAIKSLNMQIIEIDNSMKRGGIDLKKITEITQSCRINNNQQQVNEQQQKGTLNAFFGSRSKQNQSKGEESQLKDQINIDTKDSNKKVIYFRNFDIQLDTLFQNEVFKLSDNSKVPFIFSTNLIKEDDFRKHGITNRDIINFQQISEEQTTIMLYIIFEIERNFRKYHSLNPLYIQALINSADNLQTNTTNDQSQKCSQQDSKEQTLINNEEFKTFLQNFPLNQQPEPRFMGLVHKLVKMFNGDLNGCFSFIQDNMRMISIFNEEQIMMKSIEYIQIRNLKLNDLNNMYLINIPIFKLSNYKFFLHTFFQILIQYLQKQIDSQFIFQIENTYQTFIQSTNLQQSIPNSQTNLNEDILDDTIILEEHLKNIEFIQCIDIFEKKIKIKNQKLQILQDELLLNQNDFQLFYTPEKKYGIQRYYHELPKFQESIENEFQKISRNLNNMNQTESINNANNDSNQYNLNEINITNKSISTEMIDQQIQDNKSCMDVEQNNHTDYISVSNFIASDIDQIIQNLQRYIFLENYKQYDILSDKVDKIDKVYIRKSQMLHYFQLIPVLDTIKVNFIVGQKRTRSKQNKQIKNLDTVPQSIVEQTLNKNIYDQYRILLSQFNLRQQNSYSQQNNYCSNIQELSSQDLQSQQNLHPIQNTEITSEDKAKELENNQNESNSPILLNEDSKNNQIKGKQQTKQTVKQKHTDEKNDHIQSQSKHTLNKTIQNQQQQEIQIHYESILPVIIKQNIEQTNSNTFNQIQLSYQHITQQV